MIYIYSAPIHNNDEGVKSYCKEMACYQISQYIHPNKYYTLSTREEIALGTYRFIIEIEEAAHGE